MNNIFKEIKSELDEIGMSRFVKYIIGVAITMTCVWLTSIAEGLDQRFFYISITVFWWMITDTIFLEGFKMVKRISLYKNISFFLGILYTIYVIYFDLFFLPSAVFLLTSCIFSIMTNTIVIPNHIQISYNKEIPPNHEIGLKELIYNILFYVNTSNGKTYIFNVYTMGFKQYEVKWFERVVMMYFKKYCGNISVEKLDNRLQFTITYDTFEQLQDCTKLLNKETRNG